MQATVKWFNNAKGYGFIEYKNKEDIFVHYSALKQSGWKTLSSGDIVEFNLLYTSKGYQASDVISKTTNLLKKAITKENVEFDDAITTLVNMQATVKWFNDAKGYGFIEYKNKEDIFVHYSALKQSGWKTLSSGDIVEFNLLYTSKGYQASDVILKTTNLLRKTITKENVELVAAITTIAGFVLGITSVDDNLNKQEININCRNCEVQIIEYDNKQNDITINIEQK